MTRMISKTENFSRNDQYIRSNEIK